MVKVVFLVEGQTEEILINHLSQIGWFEQFNISIIANINVEGNGNFCSSNINKFILQAKNLNPEKIVILTDLECDPCIESTKNRLGSCDDCTVVVTKKAIESWLLADTELMRKLTQNETFYFEYPETTELMPIDTIKNILNQHSVRGTGPSKPRFVTRAINEGFDMSKVLEHPNLQSAKYLVDKLTSIKKEVQ